jgi:putative sigma-54 modulation protein
MTATRTPIHISAHHVSLSQPLLEFVRNKIGTIARFANDILAFEVVLRRTPIPGSERFGISVRVALPGRDIHGSASATDLYAAIGMVAGKLARRLRKRKTRLAKTYSVHSRPRAAAAGIYSRLPHRARNLTPHESGTMELAG